jgi:hypothetical protein
MKTSKERPGRWVMGISFTVAALVCFAAGLDGLGMACASLAGGWLML